jgi:hypothetical protein
VSSSPYLEREANPFFFFRSVELPRIPGNKVQELIDSDMYLYTSTAPDYGLDGRGSILRRDVAFLESRPALVATELSVQLVAGAISRTITLPKREADRSPPSIA